MEFPPMLSLSGWKQSNHIIKSLLIFCYTPIIVEGHLYFKTPPLLTVDLINEIVVIKKQLYKRVLIT